MDQNLSRRRALAAIGVTSTAFAGCLEFLPGGETDTPSESKTGGDGDDAGGDGPSGTSPDWPAIDAGEVLSDFEDLDRWEPHETSEVSAAPDEAQTGSQAAVLESDEGTATMSMFFPDGLDFEGWDTSMAVKPESVDRIIVEFIAPTRDERLTSVRTVPDDYDDWFRVDCGYEHKPAGEPDLSNVTRLNVVADGPEGGPSRMLVDDLRRTEAVDNGKAILAFYGGHQSHFELAADLLEERGWAGAVPVDPRRIGDRDRMGFDELHQLRDRGWDVCSYPQTDGNFAEQSEERRRTVIESSRDFLADNGFPDGSRHFFAPEWRWMDPTTHGIVRDLHESGFMFGACPTGAPPTGIHVTPVIWGPALHNGVRRHVNLCDQYQQLTVIRIPRVVDGAADANSMSLEAFESLLHHVDQRGLDVITPSDLVDGTMGDGGGNQNEAVERPNGVVLEAGETHSLEGSGRTETDEFDLSEGILTGQFTHDGDSEFVVELTAVDGDLGNDLLTTTGGATTGESIVTIGDGTYRAIVDADGPWSLTLDQPEVHSDDLTDVPVETSGTGSAVVGPLWTDSPLRLSVTHDGTGKFVVDGYGADGSWEQLVNKTGTFDNSRSYAASGVVWINVEADGDWTLEVTKS